MTTHVLGKYARRSDDFVNTERFVCLGICKSRPMARAWWIFIIMQSQKIYEQIHKNAPRRFCRRSLLHIHTIWKVSIVRYTAWNVIPREIIYVIDLRQVHNRTMTWYIPLPPSLTGLPPWLPPSHRYENLSAETLTSPRKSRPDLHTVHMMCKRGRLAQKSKFNYFQSTQTKSKSEIDHCVSLSP